MLTPKEIKELEKGLRKDFAEGRKKAKEKERQKRRDDRVKTK